MAESRPMDANKLLMWALCAICSINMAITGYVVTNLVTIQIKVAQIEANRFTSNDAQKLMQTLMQAQRDFEKALARLPNEIPPPWFKAEVENGLSRLERTVDRIDQRLEKLEHRKQEK